MNNFFCTVWPHPCSTDWTLGRHFERRAGLEREDMRNMVAWVIVSFGKFLSTHVLFCLFLKNSCSSVPCLNHGTCQSDPHGYRCFCTAGFTGTQCDTGTKRQPLRWQHWKTNNLIGLTWPASRLTCWGIEKEWFFPDILNKRTFSQTRFNKCALQHNSVP